MTAGHDELQVLMGAFVLGGLSDADHAAFATHLRDCPICQRELAQVSGIPRLLDLASDAALMPADPTTAAHPEPPLADPAIVLSLVRARRRRSRILTSVAAVVLAVAMLGAGTAIGLNLGRTPTPVAAARITASPVTGSQAAVQIAFVTKAWGTELQLDGANLPTAGEMALWVNDTDGRDYQVATWMATTSGKVKLTAACATHLSDIRKVELRTAAGSVVAVAQR
jgi:anti-sigma factor RsiW